MRYGRGPRWSVVRLLFRGGCRASGDHNALWQPKYSGLATPAVACARHMSGGPRSRPRYKYLALGHLSQAWILLLYSLADRHLLEQVVTIGPVAQADATHGYTINDAIRCWGWRS